VSTSTGRHISAAALHRTSEEDQVASNEFAFSITITTFANMSNGSCKRGRSHRHSAGSKKHNHEV
jgi:hypothetical protein